MMFHRSRRLATAFAYLAMWRAMVPGAAGACTMAARAHVQVTVAAASHHHASDNTHQSADEKRPAHDPSSTPPAGCPMATSCAAVMFAPLVTEVGRRAAADGAPLARVVHLPASASRAPDSPPPRD